MGLTWRQLEPKMGPTWAQLGSPEREGRIQENHGFTKGKLLFSGFPGSTKRSKIEAGAHLGATWLHLGQLGGNLGPTWGQLGPTWANLGPTWVQLGSNLGQLGPAWGQLGAQIWPARATWANLGQFGLNLGQFGPNSDAIWAQVGLNLEVT